MKSFTAHLWYAVTCRLQHVNEDGEHLCVGVAVMSFHVQEAGTVSAQFFKVFLFIHGEFFALDDMTSEAA